MTDYYEVLGVPRDATAEQIKKAYRRMAMKVHPDVAAGDDAAEQFKAVNEAYEVLSDPNKRSVYDRGGDPMGRGGADAGFSGFGGFGGGFDFTNLVDAMFGGGQTSRGPRPRVRQGQDMLVRTVLSLSEAVFGTVKTLRLDTAVVCPRCSGSGAGEGSAPVTCSTCAGQGEVSQIQRSFIGDIRTTQACPTCRGYGTIIPRPCGECSGEGRVRSSRTVDVRIPAGVATGIRVHLGGQGEVGPGGGPAGDLYVEIAVESHEVFRRDGDNLEMVIKVPMTAAALGSSVPIVTLDAEYEKSDPEDHTVQLDIPAGTQSGTRIVLKGRGVYRLRGSGRGDLGVTLLVQTPTRLDESQRELLRQLAEIRDETSVEAAVHKGKVGFFDKIKEVFGG